MIIDNLKNKKIAIAGFGVNNQKFAEYLSKNQIKFEILEWKLTSDLIGKLDEYDVVFRTPGLPYMSAAVQQALAKGVVIWSQTKLFFDMCPAPIIAVTGTKGKGTTATLISKILEQGEQKVWLAGNIGTDPFEFIDFIHPHDLVVLELSSFQLQDLHKSPHVAVVLNITADHLEESGNYTRPSHASIKEYFDAKMQIIAHQTENDFAVISHLLPEKVLTFGAGKKIKFAPSDVTDYKYQVLGRHNLENISAAVAVGKIYKIPEDKIRRAVSEFKGLPHRLQIVKVKDGITYVDDSVSTNGDSTIAAVNAFAGPVILIVGGASKGLDYTELGRAIAASSHVKGVVVVGEEAPKITAALTDYNGIVLTGAASMKEIVAQARSLATPGDTVLLSPAAASFDMFRNYKDRAEQFIKEISQ